ncbi:hypothetical protein CCM_02240 [Cordyceps militaris CM01]|uniref:Uncharacterized protein n=1 Tax=Cordyceps militaris (strain CM01) TaxID=983644 RepID=G3J8N4_CORMM|nr:uncharacterized protein CCM_02240 [Cordyceps militaris CM01]EGX93969.1 hypothetical protein CCM_02240 [Cordyceps militaris CM01]
MKVSTTSLLLASLCGSAFAAPVTADVDADVHARGLLDGSTLQSVTSGSPAGLGNLAGATGGLDNALSGVTGQTGSGLLGRDIDVDARVDARSAVDGLVPAGKATDVSGLLSQTGAVGGPLVHAPIDVNINSRSADAAVDATVDAKISAAVDAKVTAVVDAKVDAKVTAIVDAKVDAAVNAKVTAVIDAKVAAIVDAKVAAAVNAKVDATIDAKVTAAVNAKVSAKVEARNFHANANALVGKLVDATGKAAVTPFPQNPPVDIDVDAAVAVNGIVGGAEHKLPLRSL